LRKASADILELSLNRLEPDDASNYSCSAVNDVGESQRTAVLTVNCKLTPSLTPSVYSTVI